MLDPDATFERASRMSSLSMLALACGSTVHSLTLQINVRVCSDVNQGIVFFASRRANGALEHAASVGGGLADGQVQMGRQAEISR